MSSRIEYPVFSVGFGMGAGPELTAAVSNAGGFGVLGGDNLSADRIPRTVERTRALTNSPFGLNFIIAPLEDPDTPKEDLAQIRREVETAIAAGVAAVVLFWGDPEPLVDDAHRSGVKILIQVGSVEEAKRAADAGVDAVIAQGVEAGGHVRGTTSIWELLPAAVEAVRPVPVLASGGIGDGAGLARALRLGAQAVSLGTRFVASEEAAIHPAHKQRVVESTAEDTVLNELFDAWWPDAPARALRNRTVEEWEAAGRPPPGQRPGEDTFIGERRLLTGDVQAWPRYAAGMVLPSFEGDLERVPMLIGKSCTVVNDRPRASRCQRPSAGCGERAPRVHLITASNGVTRARPSRTSRRRRRKVGDDRRRPGIEQALDQLDERVRVLEAACRGRARRPSGTRDRPERGRRSSGPRPLGPDSVLRSRLSPRDLRQALLTMSNRPSRERTFSPATRACPGSEKGAVGDLVRRVELRDGRVDAAAAGRIRALAQERHQPLFLDDDEVLKPVGRRRGSCVGCRRGGRLGAPCVFLPRGDDPGTETSAQGAEGGAPGHSNCTPGPVSP